MTTIITAHGMRFSVEGAGFVKNHAASDFDTGCAAIEAALTKMDAADVAALHAADLAWSNNDCTGARPALIDQLEAIGAAEATAGWHKPEAASLMLSAAQ